MLRNRISLSWAFTKSGRKSSLSILGMMDVGSSTHTRIRYLSIMVNYVETRSCADERSVIRPTFIAKQAAKT